LIIFEKETTFWTSKIAMDLPNEMYQRKIIYRAGAEIRQKERFCKGFFAIKSQGTNVPH